MRVLFAAAAVAIVVMMVVNVVAIRLIANDNRELHDQATPSLLAAKGLTLAAADMNGAQNRYVLDFGSSRDEYIHSRDGLTDAITAATRHAETPGELRLIQKIARLDSGFQTLDAHIYSAVLARNDTRARALAAGPATSLYKQMRATAEHLVVLTTHDRSAAFTDLTSAQRHAQEALIALDAAALVLIGYLLVERRRTGRRLAAQHAAYRGLVERMPAVTAVYDRDGARFRYVSPQAADVLGVPPEELIADPKLWLSHIHPEDRERVEQAYRAALDGGQSFDETYRFTRPDGDQRWLHNVMVPAESSTGPAGEALVFDVTDQVETDARYRSLVEQLPAVVLLADGSGTCFWVSGQWERLTGRAAESIVGKTVPERWITMSHPDDRARISSWVAHREADEPFTDRFRLQHADGRWIWVELQVVVVREADGHTVYRQALLRDITERVVSEARFQDLVEHQAAVTTLYDAPGSSTLYLSPQVEQLTGYSPEYWLSEDHRGDWWGWQVIHPDDRESTLAGWLESVSRRELWEGQYRIIHRDGSVRWVVDRDAPLEGTDGLRQGSTLDVTDLVTARQEADELGARYRGLVEDLNIGVVRLTPQARFEYVSPEVEQITGYGADAMVGEEALAFGQSHSHADDAARFAAMQEAFRGGGPFRARVRFRRTDERWIWIELEAAPVFGADGAMRDWHGIMRDVTGEVSTEQQFQALVEQTPAAIGSYDPQIGRFTYVSPGLEQLSGIPSSEWLADGGVGLWRELVHPDDLATAGPAYDAAVEEQRPWRGDYRIRNRATGETRWVSSTDQTVAGVAPLRQVVTLDVTDLVEQRARYQELIEALPAAVVVYDPGTGEIAYASPQLEVITGRSAEEWRASGVGAYRAMVHPDDRTEGFERAIAAGETFSNTYRLRAADGRERWVTSVDHVVRNLAPLRQALVFDVTELHEAEQRSKEAVERLVRAGEEEQARIAGELHDDAVQVMTALLYQVRMLGGDEARSGQMEEMLTGLIERTRRLMFELRPATLQRDGIEAAVTELVRDGPWSTATVDVELPRQSETVEALSYRTIRELVVNARKHSNADTLAVTGRARDGVLEFTVSDDGVGFDVEQARDPVQMHGHLGLDTMIERIRLAGGKVEISSSPGHGAQTVFTMPAAPRTAAEPAPQR